jgi:hypothetical protein
MLIASAWKLDSITPGRHHPGDEVLGERDAGRDVVGEHRAEDEQHDHGEREREDDGVALAEELLHLDPGPGRAHPQESGAGLEEGAFRGARQLAHASIVPGGVRQPRRPTEGSPSTGRWTAAPLPSRMAGTARGMCPA